MRNTKKGVLGLCEMKEFFNDIALVLIGLFGFGGYLVAVAIVPLLLLVLVLLVAALVKYLA